MLRNWNAGFEILEPRKDLAYGIGAGPLTNAPAFSCVIWWWWCVGGGWLCFRGVLEVM